MVIRAVLSVAFIAYLFWWPEMAKGQNATTYAPNQQSGRDTKPVPPTHVIIEEPIPTIHTEQKTDGQQKGTPENPLPRFLTPEWVIVYVTAIYVITTILTWKAIKAQVNRMDQQRQDGNKSSADTLSALNRQIVALESHVKAAENTAQAAKDSADATKRNTDVLINSERAWVVITKVGEIHLTLATSAQMENNQFLFIISNKGRTVARIIEIKTESMIVDSTTTIPEHPNYPDGPYDSILGQRDFLQALVLVPGEVSQLVKAYINQTVDDQILRDINGLRKRLYVYGFIRYFDFSKEERRNQFCYQYVPPWRAQKARWSAAEVTGMPNYNTHS